MRLKAVNRFKSGSESATLARAVVATMPPLRHSIKGQPFDIGNSEVIRWLESQPAVTKLSRQWLFDSLNYARLIKYDESTGLWTGVPEIEHGI